MGTHTPKKILVAPLDWGLGHTTRCIPIIRYLLSLGHIPVFAGNASQRSFIEETFGAIDTIHLDGYNVTYSQWNKFAQAGLLFQLPNICKTIKAEHQWLQQTVANLHVDAVISDNRYGLYHPSIPSVILTHQLQIQTGMGAIADAVIQKLHYTHLNRFKETWVVDTEGSINMGGKLSHPHSLPAHARYLGLLSRFENRPDTTTNNDHLLILLSGPEPQRGMLSNILWQQVKNYSGPITFIEGSDNTPTPADIPHSVSWHKRLSQEQLTPLLSSADMVICRSGYSTLMDLVVLNKKAIIIPTPAQTEQEYLGRRLHKEGIFYCAPQQRLDLQQALHEAKSFPFHKLELQQAYSDYKNEITQWLETF